MTLFQAAFCLAMRRCSNAGDNVTVVPGQAFRKGLLIDAQEVIGFCIKKKKTIGSRGGMTFLFDVDNTLLDNDRVTKGHPRFSGS